MARETPAVEVGRTETEGHVAADGRPDLMADFTSEEDTVLSMAVVWLL